MARGLDFWLGEEKVELRGVSYGPFQPNSRGEHFPEDDGLGRDFAHIKRLGFNVVRIYELPTEAVLREARRHDLRLIAGVPWTDHTDFLSEADAWHEVQSRVREAAERYGRGDRVAVLLVGNEVEKTLVRWMGPARVKRAVEQLVAIAKEAAPECLIGYATYPSTEYILPDNADLVAVNVYLEEQQAFEKYMHRLMNRAGARPLLLSEFGLDVRLHGESRQVETYQWMLETCRTLGVAGTVWFSYTDEWFRGGEAVKSWWFGLVDEGRQERPVCASLNPVHQAATRGPKMSVVVCTYNGSATLAECLMALQRQRYANYEVIVVDDGSTDEGVASIAQRSPGVHYERMEHAGLSAARNRGADISKGEVIVYTDDDCQPDADWLMRLAQAFDDPRWVAAGGPNLPPPPRNATERCVAAAPGGPCHVLLNDEEAEHLPGCNLAIRKDALLRIGGFDAMFHAAGDDVDICWRLREDGGKLRFVPGAVVWHHRRFTFSAYLKQQRGYGHAEALLMKKHPNRFGMMGGARWRGLIYGDGGGALPPEEGSIFHGPYGTGAFQVIYASGSKYGWWDLLSGVIWLALAGLFLVLGLRWVALALMGAAFGFAAKHAASQWRGAGLRGAFQALQLWLMCLLQPVVREWARVRGMVNTGARPTFRTALPDILPPIKPTKWTWRMAVLSYWSATGKGREEWLAALRAILDERKSRYRDDDGWRWFDVEQFPVAWVTVTEYHGGPRKLTRIGVLLRYSPRLILAVVVAGMLLHGLGVPWTWWIGGVIIVASALVVGFRRRGLRLAMEAAERAGLQAMTGDDEE